MTKPKQIKYEIFLSGESLPNVIGILQSEMDKYPDYKLELLVEKKYGTDYYDCGEELLVEKKYGTDYYDCGEEENSWAVAIVEGKLKS
jgi:hypothetical protein